MSDSSFPLFLRSLQQIAKITQVLNEAGNGEDFYVDIVLREAGSGRLVGRWTDELSSSDWAFVLEPGEDS